MFANDFRGANGLVNGQYDSNGDFFPLDSLNQQINRDGDGKVLSIVASVRGTTYTQTYTYTNGLVSNISGWVKA